MIDGVETSFKYADRKQAPSFFEQRASKFEDPTAMSSRSDGSAPAAASAGLQHAQTFLTRVLPWGDVEGWLNVDWKTGDGLARRQSFTHVAAMLGGIERLKPRCDVYFCMSSQAVKDQRSRQNARFRKSLSLDVDVKPGGFATPVEALKALNLLRAAVGLPGPTLVVMTAGLTGGFHCHWILDRPLAKAEWLQLAKALKDAVKQHELRGRPECHSRPGAPAAGPRHNQLQIPRSTSVALHPSIVERDYTDDEIGAHSRPYMNVSRENVRTRESARTPETAAVRCSSNASRRLRSS